MARLSVEKVLGRAQEVARDVVAPLASTIDAEARWPREALLALQESELGGLVVPERFGGLGYGLAELAQVCEILGGGDASTGLCFGMHCVGSAVIAARATDEQAERYLDPIVAGRHLTTLALSEPGSGSHFWLPETQLERRSDAWVVDGRKTFVTSGGHADSYVISTVAADPEAPPGRFSCLILDGELPGMTWGPEWSGLGMRGNSSRGLELRQVTVGHENLLGAEGDQIWYLFNVIAPYFLTAMAGTYLGLAAAALDDARLHVVERRYSHDGSRLAHHPVVQHRVGELWAEVERARRLLRYAADEGDLGGADALPALCAAKAEVGETATSVVNGAMTLVGGIGYRDDSGFGRRLRDARAVHVMAPTTDVLRSWTGRAVLGENLLSE